MKSHENSSKNESTAIPELVGIDPKSPLAWPGVVDAIIAKARHLSADNPANLRPAAVYIAKDLSRDLLRYDPRYDLKAFVGRAVKFSAIRFSERVLGPERKYRELVPASIDAQMSQDSDDDESFESLHSESAFGEVSSPRDELEVEEFRNAFRKWLDSITTTEAKIAKMVLDGCSYDKIACVLGIAKSSIAERLQRLRKLVPEVLKEFIA